LEYKNRLRIDLHIHSTASDGSLTPADIIDQAQKLELAAIAITDHDSVNGSKEALQIGIPPSLRFLTGVEISAAHPPFFPGSGSFHILGYDIRLDHGDLNQTLNKLQAARRNRNPEILKRLNKLGFQISFKEVKQEVAEGQLGRPHIAYAMMKKGFVASIDEAFDRYLGAGKPAYVDKYRIECEQAVKIIRDAGGIPVLAHPAHLNIENEQELEALLQKLKKIGLAGIEVYYSGHSARQIRQYTALARKYGLLMTGGTDFHGSITPKIKMGSGTGDLFVPYILYEDLVNENKRSFRD
jgi:predicted metal-dependent phosphoesterase TrpH